MQNQELLDATIAGYVVGVARPRSNNNHTVGHIRATKAMRTWKANLQPRDYAHSERVLVGMCYAFCYGYFQGARAHERVAA
jgi:hypothetical protein